MPKKLNRAGEEQNYNANTGEYESGVSGSGEAKKEESTEEKKFGGFKKQPSEFDKANDKRMGKKLNKVEDWRISEALDDASWSVIPNTKVGQYAQEIANKLDIDKADVLRIMSKEAGRELDEDENLSKILYPDEDDEPESEFRPITSKEPKTEEEKELDEFNKYLMENDGEFDRLLKIWAEENGEDAYDLEKPVSTTALLEIKKREDEDKAEGVGKTMSYHPVLRQEDGSFKQTEKTVRARKLKNGLAVETKAQKGKRVYFGYEGRYKVVDVDSGYFVAFVDSYEDALKLSKDKEFIEKVNRARESMKKRRHED